MTSGRFATAAWVLLAVMLVVSPAGGQDLAGIGLKTGDRAEVTTSATTVGGTVRAVSASEIAVDDTTFRVDEVLKIDRLGDRIWHGAAIGVAVGATLGATLPRRGCESTKTFKCVGGPAVIMGLLGAWIDYKRVGRMTVFERSKGGVTIKPALDVAPGRWLAGVSVRAGR